MHDQKTAITNSYRLGYRAEIEGLRALAILVVVGNHAGISWLTGGFVGVDVFFVLSGYLITGLLTQEFLKTKKLNLIKFYSRRLKRLLPALLFMIMSVSCAAILLLAPFDHPMQASAARSASAWASNITFAFSDLNYFSQGAETNLFLHTWSLGVEEQFYLTWPLLILFFLGNYSWQHRQSDFRGLLYGLYATFIICLAFSLFLSLTKPAWAFYVMPSRAWQFALGAIIFLWTSNDLCPLFKKPKKLSSATHKWPYLLYGWLGFILIASSAILLDHNITYPGIWALLPSLGTALILITSNDNSSFSLNRAISVKPMQWLGRLSYSWYLWHWPVFLLSFSLFPSHNPVITLILAIASLLIALFSYHLIEQPIRQNKFTKPNPKSVVIFSFIFMGITVIGTTGWQRLAETWMHKPQMQQYLDVRKDIPAIYGMGCDEWFYSANVKACVFGDAASQHTAILMGDSIIGQWFPAVLKTFEIPGWRVIVLTKSSCPIIDEPWFYERIGEEYKVCQIWRDRALTAIESMKPDIVITGSASHYNFSQSQWTSGTKRILDRLAPVTRHVILLRSTHNLGLDGPSCLAQREWIPSFLPFNRDCTSKVDDRHSSLIYTWLKQAANAFNNVSTLDMNTLICPEDTCYAERNGLIVFRDNMHLSSKFASSLSSIFAKKVANIAPNIFSSKDLDLDINRKQPQSHLMLLPSTNL
jgi:peptidoglycan/LPS O-acetylase OafA/YrhL